MEPTRKSVFDAHRGSLVGIRRPVRILMFGALGLAAVLAVPVPTTPGSEAPNRATQQDPAGEVNGLAAIDPSQATAPLNPAQREQRALAEFIAKRFKVAQDAVGGFVAAAFRAGTEYRVDPLLVLAVVAVESRFNPVAESSQGAMGLMQVLPKYHQDKLAEHGGDLALLDPALNIDIGTRILREYLRRGGDVQSGLQLYLGTTDESSAQYTGKVLSERARLAQLLARVRRPGA